jgi:NADH:ubiquinone oxidoreductase subunit
LRFLFFDRVYIDVGDMIIQRLMQVLTLLWARFKGKEVGHDEFGNRYFEMRQADYWGKNRRICIYNGNPEATKIPAEWHGWMHYKYNFETVKKLENKYIWQSKHIPLISDVLDKVTARLKGTRTQRQKEQRRYDSWKP